VTGGTGVKTVWVDDGVPAGASSAADGGDGWTWVNNNPAPYAGASAHQSANAAGEHQHYFFNATATLPVNTGDILYTWIYLDPVNTPSEVMLQWYDAAQGWNYRAYWGANSIGWGTDGTTSRRYMGPLPPSGRWVQLMVPA